MMNSNYPHRPKSINLLPLRGLHHPWLHDSFSTRNVFSCHVVNAQHQAKPAFVTSKHQASEGPINYY